MIRSYPSPWFHGTACFRDHHPTSQKKVFMLFPSAADLICAPSFPKMQPMNLNLNSAHHTVVVTTRPWLRRDDHVDLHLTMSSTGWLDLFLDATTWSHSWSARACVRLAIGRAMLGPEWPLPMALFPACCGRLRGAMAG